MFFLFRLYNGLVGWIKADFFAMSIQIVIIID